MREQSHLPSAPAGGRMSHFPGWGIWKQDPDMPGGDPCRQSFISDLLDHRQRVCWHDHICKKTPGGVSARAGATICSSGGSVKFREQSQGHAAILQLSLPLRMNLGLHFFVSCVYLSVLNSVEKLMGITFFFTLKDQTYTWSKIDFKN